MTGPLVTPSRRQIVLLALRLSVTLLALYLAWRLFPARESFPRIDVIRWQWIFMAVLMFAAILVLLSLRLKWLARDLGHDLPFGLIVRINWAGLAAGQLGLGIAGAESARMAALVTQGERVPRVARLVLLDRVFGLAGLAALAGVALVWALQGAAPAMVALMALSALALAWYVIGRRTRMARIGRSGPPGQSLVLPSAPVLCCLAAAGHLMSVGIFFATAYAIGFAPPVEATFVAVSIGLFFAALPVSVGGWGVREVAIAQSYVFIGHPLPEAVGLSILFGAANAAMSVSGLLMVPRLIAMGTERRRLREADDA